MDVGDRVMTIDGEGLVVDIEFYSRIDGGMKRFGVKLDKQKYFYAVSYYFPKDLRKSNNTDD